MSGFVYIVTYDNEEWRKVLPFVKVGFANDINRRIKALSTGSPVLFVLAGFILTDNPKAYEERVHGKLGMMGCRVNREWFKIDKKSMEYFDSLDSEIQSNNLHELFSFEEGEKNTEAEMRKYCIRQKKRMDELEKSNAVMRDRLIEIDPLAHKYIEKQSVHQGNWMTYKLLKPKRQR